LADHAHIRDVFFGGENRVLVGLKEAHELLSAECVGHEPLEKPMVGREADMQTITTFAGSAEKHVLPVVGPGGIGKSRLLYESLVSLSQDGWRVFWALPGTMAKSSRWFHLLNGSQRTFVAIDNPDDSGLVRAVIEQLTTVERRNWKIIVACRSEKAGVLQQFRNHKLVAEPLRMVGLDEPASKQLLQAILNNGEEAWLHDVHTYTRGVPGWLCLIAELASNKALSTLPSNVDGVASAYVHSFLQAMDPTKRDLARELLRWLALWGVLSLEVGTEESEELRFLEEMGIASSTVRELLHALFGAGLVRNWGVAKRLYAIEPLLVREHILSDWLLEGEGEGYWASADAKQLIDRLVKGKIPAADKILAALSHLTRARLDASDGFTFLKPVFDSMITIARDGTILDQYSILHLIEKTGTSDPESGLDVLATLRTNPKANMDLEFPPWGPQTFTHDSLVSKLPWILYQMAESVFEETVAQRFLLEFRELITLEEIAPNPPERGKGAQELLERLLCGSKVWGVYAQPARDLAEAELEILTSWPFVELLLKSLLNPEREYTERIANWTLSIIRRAFVPGSLEWNLAAELRSKVFGMLQTSTDTGIRSQLWQVLAESHHQYHRMVLHGNVRGALVPPYRTVLSDDLSRCSEILQSPPATLSIEEATQARRMWSWYLEYGRNEDPLDLARQCENIYSGISKWRFHELFRFDIDEELKPEIDRVAAILRAARDTGIFIEFFAEAKRYLDAARHGGRDGLDWSHTSSLADVLADQFTPSVVASVSVLTSFVEAVLEQTESGNDLAWHFAVRICQTYLRRIKETANEVTIGKELQRLLAITPAKARLLYNLYSNAHPASIGKLTDTELDCVLEQESAFTMPEWFVLLGTFAFVRWETVQSRLRGRLDTMRDHPMKASNSMSCFIRSLRVSEVRYKWPSDQIPTGWIISIIAELELDGALLGMHELTWLRDHAGFSMSMLQMVALMRSRIELDQKPKVVESLKIMPYDFRIKDWCNFDETRLEEVSAFHEFCGLALDHGFTATYWIPKYLAQLNPSGSHVGSFIGQYLQTNPSIDAKTLTRLAYLASAYQDTSAAWAIIANPICRKAQELGREEREHVYFGLARKETGVLTSMPGEVPEHYVRARDDAARMRDAEPIASPLRGYREWALRRAESDLRQEQGRAEEIFDD